MSRVQAWILVAALAVSGSLALGQAVSANSAPASQPAAAPAALPPPPAAQVDPVEQWIQQSKNPTSWLKWGADVRLREHWTNNDRTLNEDAANHEWHYQRARQRLWLTGTPCPDLEINARLVWEFYNYCWPNTSNRRDFNVDEAMFDILNVKWKSPFGLPATVTVGRQELMFGDGWLVLDGTPLDGSRTISFDAARITYDLKDIKTTADIVYINQTSREDRWIEPFNHQAQTRFTSENDEQGVILWVANKSLEKTEIDGFFIWKHDEKQLSTGDNADIYAFGPRVVHNFNDNWRYTGQFAIEAGEKNDANICAFGTVNDLTYSFHDPKNNRLRTQFEYLSGDTNQDKGFDILWGRWPQWSEILANTWALETRPAQYTNLYRVGWGWALNPSDKTEFSLNYNLFFANQNPKAGTAGFSDNAKFRGQLLTALLTYKFNPHVSGHLLGEVFAPGNYYDDFRNDVALFLRYEVVFTW
jgi:hypothetical protein